MLQTISEMKVIFYISVVIFINTQATAQKNMPKSINMVMIGKSSKPILDLCIVDSANISEFNFDEHTIVIHAGNSTLKKIYSSFQDEKEYDTLAKYDYSFGVFLFVFRFEENIKTRIVTTRNQSIKVFEKIIDSLSVNNPSERIISKEINDNLLQKIKY